LYARVHAVLNHICRIRIRHTVIADLSGIGKALVLLHDEIAGQLVRYVD